MRTALLLLLFPFALSAQTPVHNLVMEGAGIRGLAYCGAVQALHDAGTLNELERVGGTSAGSILACFLAVGYTPDEIAIIVGNTDFGEFNDGKYFFVGGTDRMLESYGWYQGDVFLGWLESHVARKTGSADLTFEQLHDKRLKDPKTLDLYVAATNLTRQQAVSFSYETHPNMRIVDAVRVSMSVPFWFEVVHLDKAGNVVGPGEGDVYIDGGVLAYYPIDLFDAPRYYSKMSTEAYEPGFRNPETLGLRMDSDDQIESDQQGEGLVDQPIEGIDDYVHALYVLVLEELNRKDLSPEDWKRTVSISDTDLGPRVKSLSKEQKDALLQSGRDAVAAYLAQRAPQGQN